MTILFSIVMFSMGLYFVCKGFKTSCQSSPTPIPVQNVPFPTSFPNPAQVDPRFFSQGQRYTSGQA